MSNEKEEKEKVLFTGLGSTPEPVIEAISQENYKEVFIFCSEYQMEHISEKTNHSQNNEDVIRESVAGDKINLSFITCDVFTPENIFDIIFDVIQEKISEEKSIIINYSAGSAPVRLVLTLISLYGSKKYEDIDLKYIINYEDLNVSSSHLNEYKSIINKLKRKDL
ncbi:MAG: hypothetical protein ACOCP8_00920 [archaeon]